MVCTNMPRCPELPPEARLNGRRLTLTNDQVYDLVMKVDAGELDHFEKIAAILQTATGPRPLPLPPHTTPKLRERLTKLSADAPESMPQSRGLLCNLAGDDDAVVCGDTETSFLAVALCDL